MMFMLYAIILLPSSRGRLRPNKILSLSLSLFIAFFSLSFSINHFITPVLAGVVVIRGGIVLL